jgi:hypothetical protein
MYAVDELKQAGFEVWAESGKIRYKQFTEKPIDESWINNLLQNIKEHKQEAIRYLQQEPTPKQDPLSPDPIPEPGPEGAELLSSSLQYLLGINEDLGGWKLWCRIEHGREHRFATDQAGAVRWEVWYLLEPRLIIPA